MKKFLKNREKKNKSKKKKGVQFFDLFFINNGQVELRQGCEDMNENIVFLGTL